MQYSIAKSDPYIDNFTQNIEKIKRLLSDWSLRNISLIGKVTVIKTLALPILVQTFTVLQDPPFHIIKVIQDIFFKFLWSGKVDKNKRNTIIGKYENGGLKIPHIPSFIHELMISWVNLVLDPENISPWKILLTDILDDLRQDKFWYFTRKALNFLFSEQI